MRFALLVIPRLFLCWVLAPPSAGPSQEPAPRPPARAVVLREGTSLRLTFAQEVTEKIARDGDPVELALAEDLKVGDLLVAPAGSRATGVVVRSEGFRVRPAFLQVGLARVPLRGTLTIPGTRLTTTRQDQALVRADLLDSAFVDADTEVIPYAVPSADPENITREASAQPEIPPGKIRLPAGKPVRLMLMQPVSSKTAKPGDPLKFQVLDPVLVDNLVVIANKAPAAGTITLTHPAGAAWRSGGFEFKMDFVTLVNQQKHHLAASTAAKGTPTNAAYDWTQTIMQTQGLAILFLPFAPLQHGHQAILHRGSVINAMTGGDLLLERAEIEAAQPLPVEKKHGNPNITVYYPSRDNSASMELWCGVLKIAKIRKGRKLTFSLPPGKYFFRLGKRADSVPLVAEDGGEYYLRVQLLPKAMGQGSWTIDLAQAEHDVGDLESGDVIPASGKDVPDISKLDLAQLQAEPPPDKRR